MVKLTKAESKRLSVSKEHEFTAYNVKEFLNEVAKIKDSFYPEIKDEEIFIRADAVDSYSSSNEFILTWTTMESDEEYFKRLDDWLKIKIKNNQTKKKKLEAEKELYLKLHRKYGNG